MSWPGDWQRLSIRGTLCLVEISSALHSGNAEDRVGGVGREQPECESADLEDSCPSEVASQQHFIEHVLLDRDLSNTSTSRYKYRSGKKRSQGCRAECTMDGEPAKKRHG